jgi:hypothetical protein
MKRFLTGVLAGATILTLTVGCSVPRSGPKLAILMAAQDLVTAGKAGFTLKAGGKVEDLIAVLKKEAAADGGTFTAEDAGLLRKIYHSSLTIAWDKAGSGVADDDKFLTEAVIDGVVGAEVRVVHGVTYVRVSFRKLAAKFGASKADIDSIRQGLGPTTAGVHTLTAGGWVWISAADMEKFAQNAAAGAPQSDPELNKKYATEVITSAQNLIGSANVAYDKKDKTHLIVTTSTAKAYKEAERLVEATQKIADSPTAGMLNETFGADLEKAPADRPIVLDLWIDKGRFKAFEFNFLQFVEGSTGRAGLRVEFNGGTDIIAPSNAKKLDLNRIFESMTQGRTENLVRAGLGADRTKALAALVGS